MYRCMYVWMDGSKSKIETSAMRLCVYVCVQLLLVYISRRFIFWDFRNEERCDIGEGGKGNNSTKTPLMNE